MAGPLSPRLLDLEATAEYLSLSPRTVRELEHQGVIKRVAIPLGAGEIRKTLFDRLSLDRLVETWSRG